MRPIEVMRIKSFGPNRTVGMTMGVVMMLLTAGLLTWSTARRVPAMLGAHDTVCLTKERHNPLVRAIRRIDSRRQPLQCLQGKTPFLMPGTWDVYDLDLVSLPVVQP